jgi:hypothetical protein
MDGCVYPSCRGRSGYVEKTASAEDAMPDAFLDRGLT